MKPKVIGLNTLFLVPNQVGGTEYHTRGLIEALQKQDKQNKYILFCNQENYDTFTLNNSNWDKVKCPAPGKNRSLRILYEQLILPLQIQKTGCEVLHSFGYFGPIHLPANCKHLITVHDANWKDHPEDTSVVANLTLKFLIEANLKKADQILTVSEFAKRRISHHFPQVENKTKIISNAVSPKFLELAQDQPPRPIQEQYLLAVSAFYPHKKIPYLLKLWSRIKQKNPKLKLVLIGHNGQDEVKVKKMALVDTSIIWQPKVSLKELVAYYQYAELLLAPSIYEGYGYPVYEAASLGLPIIVGKTELYAAKLRGQLRELTFKPTKDVKLVNEALEKKQQLEPKILHNYQQEAAKLIKLYQS